MDDEIYRGAFVNKPVEGKDNESNLTIVHKQGTGQVFLYDRLANDKVERLWLDSDTALKMATWILDNVSN